MKELNWFDKLMMWLEKRYYNCDKNRHRWGYRLSDTGIVYLRDDDVPSDAWICLDCKIKRHQPKQSHGKLTHS